jgi:hypothetical protein
MVHHILTNGVQFRIKKYLQDKDGELVKDDEGKPVFSEHWEKNNLIKDIPAYLREMGFSAELQDMTPKTRQETETINTYLDDTKVNQADLIKVKRENNEELTRLRVAVEKMNAASKLKKFEKESEKQNGSI